MSIDIGSPIKEYIQSAMNQIKEAQTDKIIVNGPVDIEMSTILEKKKGGGLNIRVIDLGAKVSEQQIHKIKTQFAVLSDADKRLKEAQIEADIARAEQEKRRANIKPTIV